MIVTRKKPKPKQSIEHMHCWVGGNDDSVTIEFEGVYMLSTSNHRQIAYKYFNGKRTPILIKTQAQQENERLLTALYTKATVECGIFPPHFDEKVTVLAEFPRRNDVGNNFDSHNMAKFLGDWLEHIGLIDNDRDAEIFCVKRSDYDEGKTTRITICRRSAAEQETRNFISAIRGVGRRGMD